MFLCLCSSLCALLPRTGLYAWPPGRDALQTPQCVHLGSLLNRVDCLLYDVNAESLYICLPTLLLLVAGCAGWEGCSAVVSLCRAPNLQQQSLTTNGLLYEV